MPSSRSNHTLSIRGAALENKSKDGSGAATRVQFNVGGQIYEISRDIVMSHPDTMLARIASDTWQTDPTATIFINGDGERFRYVLDYLRTGCVFLPLTVPKPAILKDMEYYGFENVNPKDIDGCSATVEAVSHLVKTTVEKLQEAKELDSKIEALRKEKAYILISLSCCQYFTRHGANTDGELITICPENDKDYILADELHVAFSEYTLDVERFNKCLAQYGLYYVRHLKHTGIKGSNPLRFHYYLYLSIHLERNNNLDR
jgi:hypothetical protein